MTTNTTLVQPNRVRYHGDETDSAATLRPNLLLIPDGHTLPPARRLVVLLPGLDTPTELAFRVWQLASPGQLDVLYLAIMREPSQVYRLRRQLATLAAATRDKHIHVESYVADGKDWLQAIGKVWRPSDLVICHAEQTISRWGLRPGKLASTLVEKLKAPVYVLEGFSPISVRPPQFTALRRWVRMAVSFLILAAFFLVQIRLERLPKDWAYYFLAILSILVEIGLLFLWNTVFSD